MKGFQVFVMVMIFIFGNLKDCLMKILQLLLQSDYNLNSQLGYLGAKTRVKFSGSCLKQDKIAYTHGKIVKIYITYEISKSFNISSYPAVENCLFGSVSLTKNADIDKYKYSGYGSGLDRPGFFLHSSLELIEM